MLPFKILNLDQAGVQPPPPIRFAQRVTWTQSYPAFRTLVQQMLDGDDASNSSLSTPVLDTIISLGERRIYYDIRTWDQDSGYSAVITNNLAAAPPDLLEFRSLFVGGSIPVIYTSYEKMQGMIQLNNSRVTKSPIYYSNAGLNLTFYPIQADGTILSGRYYRRYDSITTAPDIQQIAPFQGQPELFLYAALFEAAPFMGEQSRLPEWQKRYQAQVQMINEREQRKFTRAGKWQTKLS